MRLRSLSVQDIILLECGQIVDNKIKHPSIKIKEIVNMLVFSRTFVLIEIRNTIYDRLFNEEL